MSTSSILDGDHPTDERTALLPNTRKSTIAPQLQAPLPLFVGYSLVFIAAITQASRAFLFHIAEKFANFPTSTCVFVSSVVYIIFSLLWIFTFRLQDHLRLPPVQLARLALRGFIAASTVYLGNIALAHIPVGNHLTIMALSPAMTSLLAAAFLHDSVSIRDGIILLVNVLGVALVAQPTLALGGDIATGTLVSMSAALFSSFGFIVLKKMGSAVHYMLIALSIGINGLVLSLVFMSLDDVAQVWRNPTGFWVAMVGAVLGCATQSLLNRGMQIVRPGLGLVVRTFNVPVTVALGDLFLNERVTWTLFSGVVLVIASIFAIGIGQYANDRANRIKSEEELQ